MIQLFQGDCLEVMKQIPDNSIDMVLCDLPYGITNCEWDSIVDFGALWERYGRICKPNAAIVLFCAQPFTTDLINSNRRDFRYCWYWKKNNKTGAPFAKVQPMRCIEDIVVFYKKKPTYNPQGLKRLEKPRYKAPRGGSVYTMHKATSAQEFTGYPHHLLEFKNDAGSNRNRLHPTQKPVALLEYLVKTYTNEGETVLDNCMGSGSTGVACKNTGRRFIGIEQDAAFYAVAAGRVAMPEARAA